MATTKPTWVELSTTSGSGNGTFTITAKSKNTGRLNRDGDVTVTGTGVESQTVHVVQAGTPVFANHTAVSGAIAQAGGTYTISGTSNADGLRFYWFEKQGAGGQTITSWNKDNNGYNEELGPVDGAYVTPAVPSRYEAGGIPIKNNNKQFTVGSKTELIDHQNPSDTEYNTVKELGKHSEYAWSIEINFPANTDDKSVFRQLVIQAANSSGQLDTITFEQTALANYLRVSPSEVNLSFESGANATVTIESNTSWSIS